MNLWCKFLLVFAIGILLSGGAWAQVPDVVDTPDSDAIVLENQPSKPDPADAIAPEKEIPDFNLQKLKPKMSSNDWVAVPQHDNEVFFYHKRLKQFLFAKEIPSEDSVANGEKYLRTKFPRDAKESRIASFNSIFPVKLERFIANTDTFKNQLYGAISYDMAMRNGSVALFTERVWVEEGRMWQILMVSYGVSPAALEVHENAMNLLMSELLPPNAHDKNKSAIRMLFENSIPEARAELASSVRFREDQENRRRMATEPVFRMPTQAECSAKRIAPGNRGAPPYGLRMSNAMWGACWNGLGSGLRNFATGIRDAPRNIANLMQGEFAAMGARMDAYRITCPAEIVPQTVGENWDPEFVARRRAIHACWDRADRLGLRDYAQDRGRSAAQFAASVWNWIQTHSPEDAVRLMVQTVDGFFCLNAQAQAHVACEFIAEVAATIAATAATAGAGAAVTGATASEAFAAAGSAARALVMSPYTVPRDLATGAARVPGKVARRVAQIRRPTAAGLSPQVRDAVPGGIRDPRRPRTPAANPTDTAAADARRAELRRRYPCIPYQGSLRPSIWNLFSTNALAMDPCGSGHPNFARVTPEDARSYAIDRANAGGNRWTPEARAAHNEAAEGWMNAGGARGYPRDYYIVNGAIPEFARAGNPTGMMQAARQAIVGSANPTGSKVQILTSMQNSVRAIDRELVNSYGSSREVLLGRKAAYEQAMAGLQAEWRVSPTPPTRTPTPAATAPAAASPAPTSSSAASAARASAPAASSQTASASAPQSTTAARAAEPVPAPAPAAVTSEVPTFENLTVDQARNQANIAYVEASKNLSTARRGATGAISAAEAQSLDLTLYQANMERSASAGYRADNFSTAPRSFGDTWQRAMRGNGDTALRIASRESANPAAMNEFVDRFISPVTQSGRLDVMSRSSLRRLAEYYQEPARFSMLNSPQQNTIRQLFNWTH